MQVDGVPGGGCFVKWKLCATSPGEGTVNVQDQCRITITAAAAAPLGSWFKGNQSILCQFIVYTCFVGINHFEESIRTALLFQAEELWTRAIEYAVTSPETTECTSTEQSQASRSSSSSSLAPLLLSEKLSSVSLVYFDRKLFFKSMTRMIAILSLVALTVAIMIYRFSSSSNSHQNSNNNPSNSTSAQSKYIALIEAQYTDYIYRKLRIEDSVPEGMMQVSGQLAELDGRVSGIVGKMQSIKRFMQAEPWNQEEL